MGKRSTFYYSPEFADLKEALAAAYPDRAGKIIADILNALKVYKCICGTVVDSEEYEDHVSDCPVMWLD